MVEVQSYRDVWCDWHRHLGSDYECDLIRFPFDQEKVAEDYVWNVTVKIERDDG